MESASEAMGTGAREGTLASERFALVGALLTTGGSLYLSMGMGLNACPLCFYQRSFVMAVAAVLGVGMLLRQPLASGTLSLLSLPLALSGLGVALAHNNLVWSEVLVCPAGIFGLGSAPLQSLIAYVVVTVLLLPGAVQPGLTLLRIPPRVVGAVATGAVLAALCVLSSPKPAAYKPTFDASGIRIVKVCERAHP